MKRYDYINLLTSENRHAFEGERVEGEKCKKGLGFGYKNRDYVLLWVKFCIRNIVLGVSRRKNPKIFPCGAFYSCVFKEVFIEVP